MAQARGILAQTAAKGRRTDTLLGHLTPGDLVVPADRVTPGILASLGQDAPRYLAGSPDNSINPKTGLPEFFDGEGGMGSEGSGGGVGADLGGGRGTDPRGEQAYGTEANDALSPAKEAELGQRNAELSNALQESDRWNGSFGGWLGRQLGYSQQVSTNPMTGAYESVGQMHIDPLGIAAGFAFPGAGLTVSAARGLTGQNFGTFDVDGYGRTWDGGTQTGYGGTASSNTGGNQTGINAGDPTSLARDALGSVGIGGGNQGAGPLAQQAPQPFPNWSNPYLAPAKADPAKWQAMWNQRNRGILGG